MTAEPTVRMYSTGERTKGFSQYVCLYVCTDPKGTTKRWEYEIPESRVSDAEAAGARRME